MRHMCPSYLSEALSGQRPHPLPLSVLPQLAAASDAAGASLRP